MAAKPAWYSRSSDKYEPLSRFEHISGCVENRHIVQGGKTQDFSERSKRELNSVIEVFDASLEKWKQERVRGDVPTPGIYDAASASASSFDGCIYSFGGNDGSQLFNTLYKLHYKSKTWTLLSPQNADGAPMPKRACGMVVLGYSIVIVNGHGLPRESIVLGSSFIKDSELNDGRGWTNELHVYNILKDTWSCPVTSGEIPPPCSDFTFTAIDERRAVFFGGYNEEQGRMNDIYIFDISTLSWKRLKKSQLWPDKRSRHATCCLNYDQISPQLLMTGGLDEQNRPQPGAWVFSLMREKWRKVNGTLKGHWGHSLTVVSLAQGLTEVMQFGGSCATGQDDTQFKLGDTTLLQFKRSFMDFQWELLSVAENEKIGSQQRIIDKMKLLLQEKSIAEEVGETEEAEEVKQKGKEEIKDIMLVEKLVQVNKMVEQVYELEGYGLKVHIHKMLQLDDEYFQLRMAVLTTEEYQLPADNGVLVSAIYQLDHGLGDRNFSQPVTLQMQHCLSDVSHADLSIVWSDNRVPPYRFKSIPGGRFNEIPGYSLVSVNHFSVFSVLYKLIKRYLNPHHSIQFMAVVYYTHVMPGSFKFHLFIVKHLDAAIEKVKSWMERDYSGRYIKGATSVVEIGEVYELKLPKNAVSGWTMNHDNYNKMDHRGILSRQPDVPFQVSVDWKGLKGKQPQKLEYMLQIESVGIKIESPVGCIAFVKTVRRRTCSAGTPMQTKDFKNFPPPTLLQLMEIVGVKLQMQWRFIGLGLGLEAHTLDVIGTQYSNPQECMARVFIEWKNQATSEYSWKTMAKVVSLRSVNQSALLLTMWDALKLCSDSKVFEVPADIDQAEERVMEDKDDVGGERDIERVRAVGMEEKKDMEKTKLNPVEEENS